jgi:chemotaxis protein CheX
MDKQFAKPFVIGATNVIEVMAGIKVKSGEVELGNPGANFGAITGLLGMSSADFVGNMLIRFDEGSILQIVSAMLREDFTSINHDIIDAVGEITNMVVGGAKKEFEQLGQRFDMASPAVINGSEVYMSQACRGSALIIPFEVSKGRFVIEAAFEKARQ